LMRRAAVSVSKRIIGCIILILVMGLAGCSRQPSTPLPTPIPTISPDVLITAKLSMAKLFVTEPSSINLISAQRQDWPDSCLGLGAPNEACVQGGIPGWLLIVEVDGARYKVRLNDDGSVARIAGEMPSQ
jgi:hypothetical protein